MSASNDLRTDTRDALVGAIATFLGLEAIKLLAFLLDAQCLLLAPWMIWPAGVRYGLLDWLGLRSGESHLVTLVLFTVGLGLCAAWGWSRPRAREAATTRTATATPLDHR